MYVVLEQMRNFFTFRFGLILIRVRLLILLSFFHLFYPFLVLLAFF
jgi:hypothetical protein